MVVVVAAALLQAFSVLQGPEEQVVVVLPIQVDEGVGLRGP